MQTHQAVNPQYLSTSDVARELGVVPDTVRLWARAGMIAFLQTPSGVRLFAYDDVRRLAVSRAALYESRSKR